jgi:hypothetical protein
MNNANVLRMPGIKELPASAPKSVRSIMDTLLVTPAGIDRWKKPPFQRELKVTAKVVAFAEELKTNGGVISGIITLGKLGGETYLVDGQHRVEGFKISGLTEGLADVRICHFDDMAEMGDEFVRLNSALRRLMTDDILRGLEGSHEFLVTIRKRCPFVGYDNLRRGNASSMKLIAMSTTIRAWLGSSGATPSGGPNSSDCVRMFTSEITDAMTKVLTVCFEAWGKDPENYKLWGALNLVLTFWLWRRLVLNEGASTRRGGVPTVKLDPGEFRQCLMAVAANGQYVQWLHGRTLSERDRGPAYARIKAVFAGRLGGMGFGRPNLPSPDWAGGR